MRLAVGLLAVAISPAALSAGATPYDACFNRAGQHYRVSPLLLKSIARVESSMNPRALNQNTNKSRDIGLMQINSSWFSKLRKHGISEESLWEPCVNITVGAWILADAISRHGLSWKAIGVYHSPTPARQAWYAGKVASRLRRELEAQGVRLPATAPASAKAAPVRARIVAWEGAPHPTQEPSDG